MDNNDIQRVAEFMVGVSKLADEGVESLNEALIAAQEEELSPREQLIYRHIYLAISANSKLSLIMSNKIGDLNKKPAKDTTVEGTLDKLDELIKGL